MCKAAIAKDITGNHAVIVALLNSTFQQKGNKKVTIITPEDEFVETLADSTIFKQVDKNDAFILSKFTPTDLISTINNAHHVVDEILNSLNREIKQISHGTYPLTIQQHNYDEVQRLKQIVATLKIQENKEKEPLAA